MSMATPERQQAVPVPPLAYQRYPVDALIRIYRRGARYGADIFAVAQMVRVPIEMSPGDVVALNRQLQATMEKITGDVAGGSAPEEHLRPLAEIGHYVFRKVFSHRDARLAVDQLMELGGDVSIQVASEDFFLPWELIYPASLDKPLSYEHFLGMNTIISRVIIQDAWPGAFISPLIPVDAAPKLGLLTDQQLPAVLQKEIPHFEKLHDEGRIILCKLRPLDPESKLAEFREFKQFWHNELQLAHFACHAAYEETVPDRSHIVLSDEFPITLMDLEVYGIAILGHPLVVLNACQTGNLNPLHTAYFAGAFLRYGARGVVATECAVPDEFAADFAAQLYAHLLDGESLGTSLLAVRRHFLRERGDPTGLLYSMYAPPAIRLTSIGAWDE
jgi:hypothetical protein